MELAGVEPASKRGSNRLSTCLAPTWFSSEDWIRATDPHLSFLSFASWAKQPTCYLRFSCTTGSDSLRAGHPGDVSSQHLVPGLSINLLNSVTQQERSYFRQLMVRSLRFTSQQTKLGMLTYLFYTLSKPVSPMWFSNNWYPLQQKQFLPDSSNI